MIFLDVYPLILSYLDANTLQSASLVSSHLRDLASDPRLWVSLCFGVYGINVDELSPPDAKKVYWLMDRRLKDLKQGALLGPRLRSASF